MEFEPNSDRFVKISNLAQLWNTNFHSPQKDVYTKLWILKNKERVNFTILFLDWKVPSVSKAASQRSCQNNLEDIVVWLGPCPVPCVAVIYTLCWMCCSVAVILQIKQVRHWSCCPASWWCLLTSKIHTVHLAQSSACISAAVKYVNYNSTITMLSVMSEATSVAKIIRCIKFWLSLHSPN